MTYPVTPNLVVDGFDLSVGEGIVLQGLLGLAVGDLSVQVDVESTLWMNEVDLVPLDAKFGYHWRMNSRIGHGVMDGFK